MLNCQQQAAVEAQKTMLNEAFKAMRRAKIVARQNFSCCGGCGHYEMGVYLGENPTKGFKGYAFFHAQDEQRRIEGHGVWIKYGSVSDQGAVEVGSAVFKCLVEAGLEAGWDGRAETAIEVRGPRS